MAYVYRLRGAMSGLWKKLLARLIFFVEVLPWGE